MRRCADLKKCTHFTFVWGKCWYKKSDSGRKSNKHAKSGRCVAPAAAPVDAVTTTSTTITPAVPESNGDGDGDGVAALHGSCTIESNIDFNGNDLWSKKYSSADLCVADCLAHKACTHFTHLGRWCYFKQSAKGRKKMVGAKSGTCTKAAAATIKAPTTALPPAHGESSDLQSGAAAAEATTTRKCKLDAGYDYWGYDLWNEPATSVDVCLAGCVGECSYFTYAWGNCYYKSSAVGRKQQLNAVSGACL